MMATARRTRSLLALTGVWLGLALPGCSEEGEAVAVSTQRGAPKLASGKDAGDGAAKKPAASKKPAAGETKAAAPVDDEGEGEGEGEEALPPRPTVALDSKSFTRRRDPFQSFRPTELVTPEPDRPRAERSVSMRQYAFEDLKLIAIVNSGRGIVPRALFLASDGKSWTIKQGEYFSSAEVLLAAVNRDYVEIEVVDDELAASLNLQRGERRAIYLRNDE